MWTFTPMAVALATFAAYVWSGHDLDVASALTALSLFNVLRFPLTMLPRSTYKRFGQSFFIFIEFVPKLYFLPML